MMRVHIVAGNLCDFPGDAIVNACNPAMLGGGGVDGAIHRAAGPELKEACKMVWADENGVRCPTGVVRPTPAFNLPCKWVIHTAGPIFELQRSAGRARVGEETDLSTHAAEVVLRQCFSRAAGMASVMGLRSIAFPAISTGVYGCPQETCARVAAEWAKDYPTKLWLDVWFYIYPSEHLGTWMRVFEDTRVEFER